MFRAGDQGRSMFFINSGSVVVIVNNRSVDSFEARDYFGEVGMLLGEKRSATISATANTELLQLDVDAFYQVASDVPEFPLAMKEALLENGTPAKRVSQAVSILAKLTRADLHPRALSPRVKASGATSTPQGRQSIEEWEGEIALTAARRSLPVGSLLREDLSSLEQAKAILSDPLAYSQEKAGFHDSAVAALQAVDFLQNLPKILVAELLTRCAEKTYRRDEIIVEGSESVDKVYVLCTGCVRVLIAGGQELRTHVVSPGQSFGLIGHTTPPRGVCVMEALPIERSTVCAQCDCGWARGCVDGGAMMPQICHRIRACAGNHHRLRILQNTTSCGLSVPRCHEYLAQRRRAPRRRRRLRRGGPPPLG